MALRSAKCYRKPERPNTRISISKPRRSYVKGVPAIKIHRFESGVKKEYQLTLYLNVKDHVQIRHNALEAARLSAMKELEKRAGPEAYFLKVLVYPHHVLRENPLATGAGADRFQTGMRKSFGKPIGTAAIVRPGQRILEAKVDKIHEKIARKALKIASSKLPSACRIEVLGL
jgi:large subunit ribosomal protein L10e